MWQSTPSLPPGAGANHGRPAIGVPGAHAAGEAAALRQHQQQQRVGASSRDAAVCAIGSVQEAVQFEREAHEAALDPYLTADLANAILSAPSDRRFPPSAADTRARSNDDAGGDSARYSTAAQAQTQREWWSTAQADGAFAAAFAQRPSMPASLASAAAAAAAAAVDGDGNAYAVAQVGRMSRRGRAGRVIRDGFAALEELDEVDRHRLPGSLHAVRLSVASSTPALHAHDLDGITAGAGGLGLGLGLAGARARAGKTMRRNRKERADLEAALGGHPIEEHAARLRRYTWARARVVLDREAWQFERQRPAWAEIR